MAQAARGEEEKGIHPSEDDQLTVCPICFEQYKTPKYLPCLHTFCEACLQTYIESTCQNKGDPPEGGFKCPICRREVFSPNISGNPSEWAAMLPVNHLITTLMDKMSLESRDKKCSPCARENETERAVSWCKQCGEALCKTCEKCHNRNKFTKIHNVVSLTVMKNDAMSCETPIFCSEHAEELLKFYCDDHAQAGCMYCITLKHRKCEHVDTIENAAKSFFAAKSDSRLSSNICDLLERMRQYSSDRESEMNTSDTIAQAMMKEISTFRGRLNSHLDSLEEEIRKKIEGKQKEGKIEFEGLKEEMKNNIAYLDNLRKTLEITQKNGSSTQYFVECKRLCPLVADLEKTIKENYNKVSTTEHTLSLNPELTQVLSANSFGTINTEQKILNLLPANWPVAGLGFSSKKPHLLTSFQSPDKTAVQSALFLPDSNLILGDRNSWRCVVINRTGKKLKEISMPGRVSDLAFLNENEILVSFPFAAKLLVLGVKSLTKQREIPIPSNCYGVDATNEGLIYVSLESSVHCLDSAGNSKWNVSVPETVIDSRHVRVGKDGNIYYPDWDNNKVLCFDRNGKEIAQHKYKDIKSTYGLDVDSDGNIVCCGFHSDNVYQVSSDGQSSREILTRNDGIEKPWCIQFQTNSCMFMVGNDCGKEIRIYEMK